MSSPELDWRGKSVRQFTPDDMQQFAIWALREITRLRQERDGYLDRATRAENNPVLEHDTLAERKMDTGTSLDRLIDEYRED